MGDHEELWDACSARRDRCRDEATLTLSSDKKALQYRDGGGPVPYHHPGDHQQ
ncbi:hypothetical protein GCM10023191_009220 [Actinoallomurus oryzae]|uniref:Uncharacterized protein n=1 Tax=Actinoallomurus oryzae TaxID=502180 RepID=A0ABP8PEW4_9ACTN